MNWSRERKENEPQRKTRKVASQNATTAPFLQKQVQNVQSLILITLDGWVNSSI